MTDTLDHLNNELLSCHLCPRLVAWREEMACVKRLAYQAWEYWGKPVPGFGDPHARVLVVGLAPGAHGSNRTGRMFTGDASGDFLFPALYRASFASQSSSHQRGDGLMLNDLYITAVCHCAPPENKPTAEEVANCRQFLVHEIELIRPKVFVALGKIAFDGLLYLHPVRNKTISFAHAACYHLMTNNWLVCSFHPSRQNTQTGRLTEKMFDQVWRTVRKLLNSGS